MARTAAYRKFLTFCNKDQIPLERRKKLWRYYEKYGHLFNPEDSYEDNRRVLRKAIRSEYSSIGSIVFAATITFFVHKLLSWLWERNNSK